jgi:hypothetical protein
MPPSGEGAREQPMLTYTRLTKIALTIATTVIGSLTLVSGNAQAQDPRVEQYLIGIRQNLAITDSGIDSSCEISRIFPSDNGITCLGAKSSACTTTLVLKASLIDLLNQDADLSEDDLFVATWNQLEGVRRKAECLD